VRIKKSRLKVGIIGCGAIGTEIAKACQERLKDKIELIGICDIDAKKASNLNNNLKKKVPIFEVDELIRRASLVVEAASASVSGGIIEKVVKNKKSCLVMSVGGLLGKEGLLKRAAKAGVKIYLPSGAICGIDGLKSANVGAIDRVTLTTRKPLRALEGAPYLVENNIDLSSVKHETVIFEGSAKEAIRGFPQNVNVSAILSLAGIGAGRTRVRIVASPDYTKNVHEVEIGGAFGRIVTRTENMPSKANPKTSQLAIFSAIATLEGIVNSVKIGT